MSKGIVADIQDLAENKPKSDDQPPEAASAELPKDVPEVPAKQTLPALIAAGSFAEVKARFAEEASEIFNRHEDVTRWSHCMALFEPEDSINQFDLDQIFKSLKASNSDRSKDVTLFLLSGGGRIEPAYQISKLCKSFSRNKFTAVVPRQAKSAATLICLGADEIHMGPLGHLGPIDPQLGSLPALGVNQALNTIAAVAEKYPKSADMFARYLRTVLTVEQIGYCERIGESAVQYGVRLLSNKPQLKDKSLSIAQELVHEYKDHSFVIDIEEAKQHLGADWISTDTKELKMAEELYSLFENYNFLLEIFKKQKLLIIGDPTQGDHLLIHNKRTE